MGHRQILQGMLDTAILALFVGLAALNSGFLPSLESEAHAAFGVCRSSGCPADCTVWSQYAIGEEPWVIWVEDTCNVSAPGTQWAGFCDGVCGICALGSRCSGVTARSGVPCACVSGGC
ncbi:MAG TPA: hypothetical protein VFG20_05090 [Planctomycetaceae bacterium]|jgi:hypothetical protein|nr:hypothetical protein [Planctomycetaceae bacterium]